MRRDIHINLSPVAMAMLARLMELSGHGPSAVVETAIRRLAVHELSSSGASNPDTAPPPALPQPYRRRRREQKA